MSAIKITNSNFEKEVTNSTIPVIIDFWAGWCGPCKMLSPIIEEVANTAKDYKVCKINIDEEPDLARKFSVMSIPTLLVFKNGNIVNKAVGFRSKEQVLALLK